MAQKKATMYTLIFVALFALMGLAHYFESNAKRFETLLFCMLTLIYIGLIVVWYHSLRVRLLPTRARLYFFAAAWLMVFFMVIRTVRYRFVPDEDLYAMQWTWYAYYIPSMFIPTLFLMACIYSAEWQGATDVHVDERWLLVVPAVFFAVVCTNQWHNLVFEPFFSGPLVGWNATYWYGPFFYVIWTVFISEAVLGLGLLVSGTRKTQNWFKAMMPFAVILAFTLLLTYDNYLGSNGIRRKPYNPPELSVFGMLAVFECSIRLRFIPYNENYAGFFAGMLVPAVITDGELNVRWQSGAKIEADKEKMRQALDGAAQLDEDTRLFAHRLDEAGYVFYAENEHDLRDLNRQLAQANATIEEENNLIAVENELQEQAASVRQRNDIYRHIREMMASRQRRIDALLTQAEPNTPHFRHVIAEVLVLSAFVKRGSNMLLTMADGGNITYADLDLAIDEPLRYLKYCNIHAGANVVGDGEIEGKTAFDLYATFGDVIEALIPAATRILVALEGGKLRIMSNAPKCPALPQTPIEVQCKTADGGCYFTIDGGKEVGA